MVVDTLGGFFCGPRTPARRFIASRSAYSLGGSTSAAGLKWRRSAAVGSRTSPSSSIRGARLLIVIHLTFICLAKADDANAISHRGEAQHMQAVTNVGFVFGGVELDLPQGKLR